VLDVLLGAEVADAKWKYTKAHAGTKRTALAELITKLSPVQKVVLHAVQRGTDVPIQKLYDRIQIIPRGTAHAAAVPRAAHLSGELQDRPTRLQDHPGQEARNLPDGQAWRIAVANPFLEAALAWAARGFRVFPLQENGAKPAWAGWPDTATTNPDTIRAWWDGTQHNVGICTTGLLVIDIDVKGGRSGMASWQALHGEWDTLTVRTRSGGYHLYYAGADVALSVGALGEGLDVRSHNGYVVAPGSLIDGKGYEIVIDQPLAQAPPQIVARCRPPGVRAENADIALVDLDTPAAVQAAQGARGAHTWGCCRESAATPPTAWPARSGISECPSITADRPDGGVGRPVQPAHAAGRPGRQGGQRLPVRPERPWLAAPCHPVRRGPDPRGAPSRAACGLQRPLGQRAGPGRPDAPPARPERLPAARAASRPCSPPAASARAS